MYFAFAFAFPGKTLDYPLRYPNSETAKFPNDYCPTPLLSNMTSILLAVNMKMKWWGFHATLQKEIDRAFKVRWYFVENRRGRITWQCQIKTSQGQKQDQCLNCSISSKQINIM